MVAFYFPEGRSVSLDADYLRPLGLGDCTIANGYLQADLPLTPEQIKRIEAEGFVRADTHWYSITPEPAPSSRGAFIRALGQIPSTTLPPSRDNIDLQLSFVNAVTDTQTAALKGLGYTVTPIAAPKGQAAQFSHARP